jgi:hypothetical protein
MSQVGQYASQQDFLLGYDLSFAASATDWKAVDHSLTHTYDAGQSQISFPRNEGLNANTVQYADTGPGAGRGDYGTDLPAFFTNLLVRSNPAKPSSIGDGNGVDQAKSQSGATPRRADIDLAESASKGSSQFHIGQPTLLPATTVSFTPSVFDFLRRSSATQVLLPTQGGINFRRLTGVTPSIDSYALANGSNRDLFKNQLQQYPIAASSDSWSQNSVSEMVSNSLSRVHARFGRYLPTQVNAATAATAAKSTRVVGDSEFLAALKTHRPEIDAGTERALRVNGFYGNDGIVYVNADAATRNKVPISTVFTHEALHHYTNPVFDRFVESDPVASQYGHALREGVTEYFTQQVVGTQNKTTIYPNETRIVRDMVEVVGEEILQRAFFKGDPESMQRIKDYLNSAGSN